MIRNVYLHLPFCLKKCRYCDFAVHAIGTGGGAHTEQLKDRYLKYLKREIAFWKERLDCGPMQTIYLGGGTPSVYDPKQLGDLLHEFTKESNAEITLELDPGTFDT